jgi:predicted DNA-binding transcriptional regulator AlpA
MSIKVAPPPEREALRVKEFCAIVGISESQFYALKKRGLIRAIKIGGCLRVPVAEKDRILRGEAA